MGLFGVNFWSRDFFFGFVGRPRDFLGFDRSKRSPRSRSERPGRRLACLRSHVLRAYCNFESKQASWSTPK